MDPAKFFGVYIRTLRNGRGLSQEAVARRLDISTKQVSNWERGVNTPNLESLVHLLAVIGGEFSHIKFMFDAGMSEEEAETLARVWLEADIEMNGRPD